MLRKVFPFILAVVTGCLSVSSSSVPTAIGAGEEDVLRLPHLVANRVAKRIEIDAITTEVKESDILEFLLISRPSGHAYESLAVSEVKPGDVQKALKFIGMEPGHGVNPAKLQFWPKGERAVVSVILKNAPEGTKPTRVERLVLNERTKAPIPDTGFVFIGSRMIPEREFSGHPKLGTREVKETGKMLFAADAREPNSIIANYNESDSIFDVPRVAVKSDVYRSQVANPDTMLPTNAPVTFIIEPEYKDGKKRVKDMTLLVTPAGSAALKDTVFTLANMADKKVVLDKSGLNSVLKTFTTLVEQGHDPFVTLQFADDLTVGTAHQICKLLSSIDTATGIRMDPPPAGHLYYRAFMPNEKLRERRNRVVQPWELHLTLADGKLTGKLVAIDQIWQENKLKPDLATKETVVADANALVAELKKDTEARKKAKKSPRLAIILVFSPVTVTHAQLINFVGPAQKTHPIIHIYPVPKPQ